MRTIEDKSLAGFCSDMRYARRDPGNVSKMKLNEEHIASLDALGFDWSLNITHEEYNLKSFEERIEDRKAALERSSRSNRATRISL